MPAVQLARLKRQIDSLAWHFTRPAEFCRGLHELMETYGDLTYRPTPAVKQSTGKVPSYHVPVVVMRQLELSAGQWAQENAPAALDLIDALWQEPMSEPRYLAAYLLGMLPLDLSPTVTERLQRWARPGEEKEFLQALFKQGTVMLRRQAAGIYFNQVRDWLNETDLALKRIGLLAVRPLIEDRSFENLPAVFNAVGPVLQAHPGSLKHELVEVIIALSQRSPTETAYFVRQMAGQNTSPDLLRLLRRCVAEFPENIRTQLHSLVQTQTNKGY